jgi:acyl-[acyl-carrier-protein]-phospholipid O-acyltransferase/long-chain-fatty-acid--[acyl-carrier-protein] ligase
MQQPKTTKERASLPGTEAGRGRPESAGETPGRHAGRGVALIPYFIIRLCLWILTHSLYRVRARGLENLPRQGGALLVSNHVSFIDPFLIAVAARRYIRFLMWRNFYEKPGIHWLVRLMGVIPIAREDPPRQVVVSLREAQARLREGELVCIFAEGAITRTGNLLRFHRGLERITQGIDAPIIPVHLDRLWGSIFSYERGRFFTKWPQRIPYSVTVSFGSPLPPETSAFQARQAVMRLGADAFAHRDSTQRTLPELFIAAAKRHWWRFSMADSFGRKLSFLKALTGTMLFRGLILKKCPQEKMIGVLLPPMVPSALLNAGISMAGRVPVNLNYTASVEALDYALGRCQLRTIITSEKLLERFSIARRPGMVMIEDVAKEISRAGKLIYAAAALLLPGFLLRRWLVPGDLTLDSLATVIFSSGSTGLPKGVMLSHRNIVSNVEGAQQAISINRDDCLLGILPFFHSFGFTVGLWLPLISGCAVAFHTNPLEARTVGELCRKHHVTLLISTPTFAWKYVQVCAREDFASLRMAIVGAEKMKLELARAFEEKFGATMFEGYGCTELSPVVSVGAPNYVAPDQTQPGHKPGTVGHPIPGVAARVVNPDTLQDLGCEKEGMLLIKSPGVMQGYLGEPEKTRQVLTEDGWYITGDIAKLDEDGFITITDRLSRFSKIAGEMVPHVRVEDALHKALGTEEPKMVVTSVPDEQKGEKLVVLHTELGLEIEELLRRLRETDLPRLWMPRKEGFYRIDSLPVLGTGKLDLKRIKDAAKRLAAVGPAPSRS